MLWSHVDMSLNIGESGKTKGIPAILFISIMDKLVLMHLMDDVSAS